jgi:hypothetical protein
VPHISAVGAIMPPCVFLQHVMSREILPRSLLQSSSRRFNLVLWSLAVGLCHSASVSLACPTLVQILLPAFRPSNAAFLPRRRPPLWCRQCPARGSRSHRCPMQTRSLRHGRVFDAAAARVARDVDVPRTTRGASRRSKTFSSSASRVSSDVFCSG